MIKINPCKMTFSQRVLLSNFIKKNPNTTIIHPDVVYSLDSPIFPNQKFSLSHTLLRRQRKGDKVGFRYEVVAQTMLDKGGTGRVYSVYQTLRLRQGLLSSTVKTKRRVVKIMKLQSSVKNLCSPSATYAVSLTRQKNSFFSLRRLSEINASVSHLHAKKAGSDPHNKEIYLVYKKMPGKNLEEIFKTEVLTTEKKLQLAIALLRALKEQVHAYGLVHRDIKPKNVMVHLNSKEAFPKVNIIDYEEAKRTHEDDHGQVVGTFDYIAPEVFKGSGSSYASDLYSLGKILCQLFSKGHALLASKEEEAQCDEIFNQHVNGEIIEEKKIVWMANQGINNPLLFQGETLDAFDREILKELLKQMCCCCPSRRFSTELAIEALEDLAIQRHERLYEQRRSALCTRLYLLKKQLSTYTIVSSYFRSFSVPKDLLDSDEKALNMCLNRLLRREKDLTSIEKKLNQIEKYWKRMGENKGALFLAMEVLKHCSLQVNTPLQALKLPIKIKITSYVKTHLLDLLQLHNRERLMGLQSSLKRLNDAKTIRECQEIKEELNSVLDQAKSQISFFMPKSPLRKIVRINNLSQITQDVSSMSRARAG